MTPRDRTLFLELGTVNTQLSAFGFALLEGMSLSAEEHISLAHRLVDLAEALRQRAERIHGEVVEGSLSDVDD